MACSDVPRFRTELLRSCAQLSAPECQKGVAQAAEAYGDQCLLLPLYSSVATASVAAYVCPKATGALAVRCEAVAPGLVGPAPHTGDPAPSPGAAGQGPSAGLIAGGSVVGLGALGGALEYYARKAPWIDQLGTFGGEVPDAVRNRVDVDPDGTKYLADQEGRRQLVFQKGGNAAHPVIVNDAVTFLGKQIRPQTYALGTGVDPYKMYQDPREGPETYYLPELSQVERADPIKPPGFFKSRRNSTWVQSPDERQRYIKQVHRHRISEAEVGLR